MDFEDGSSEAGVPSGGKGGGGVAGVGLQRSIGCKGSVVGASGVAVSVGVEAVLNIEVSVVAVSVVREKASGITSSDCSNNVGASGVVVIVDGNGHIDVSSIRVEDAHGIVLISSGPFGDASIVDVVLVGSAVVKNVDSSVVRGGVASSVVVPLLPDDVGGVAGEVGVVVIVVEHFVTNFVVVRASSSWEEVSSQKTISVRETSGLGGGRAIRIEKLVVSSPCD